MSDRNGGSSMQTKNIFGDKTQMTVSRLSLVLNRCVILVMALLIINCANKSTYFCSSALAQTKTSKANNTSTKTKSVRNSQKTFRQMSWAEEVAHKQQAQKAILAQHRGFVRPNSNSYSKPAAGKIVNPLSVGQPAAK